MSRKELRVLILGGGKGILITVREKIGLTTTAGNCGLALAHGLKKAGIDYGIYERDTEDDFYHRPRDWGMLLHWGTEYLEKLLPSHLRQRIKEPRCDSNLETSDGVAPIPFLNAVTEETMAEIPLIGNRLSRRKLRKFLTEEENLNIQFGKTLREITVNASSVHAMFDDGSLASGDIAIGCDGSHSKVREFLVGHDAAQLESVDLTMINFPKGAYTQDEARLLQTVLPVFKIAAHPTVPGNSIIGALDIADPSDPTTWLFQNYIGWWGPPYAQDLRDPKARMDFYRSFASRYCEPFRTALLKVSEEEVLPIYPGQQWAPNMGWNNRGGKVTLAGDAAHSMVPQRGQGLNAIKDASDIVDAITSVVAGETSLENAITAYEAEMKSRGTTEVRLSLEQAFKARNRDTIKDSPIFRLGWQREKAATPAQA